MPRATAEVRRAGGGPRLPSTLTTPPRSRPPKIAGAISSRPEPVMPAMPTISPACTWRSDPVAQDVREWPGSGRRGAPARARPPDVVLDVLQRPADDDFDQRRPRSARSTGRVVTSFPSRSTVTESDSPNTSSKWCDTNTTAMPDSAIRRVSWNSRSASAAGRFAVGSSRTSSFGLRPGSTWRGRWPPRSARSWPAGPPGGARRSRSRGRRAPCAPRLRSARQR